MSAWTIRPEQPADIPGIAGLVVAAFAGTPHGDGTEASLVARLRADGDLVLSLVAEAEGVLIGHIGFDPVTVDGVDVGWMQLSPLSVLPAWQRRGVGSALIAAGVEAMRRAGVRGIGVLGDPVYYERFGFRIVPGLGPAGDDAPYFRALILASEPPRGVLRYADAFY